METAGGAISNLLNAPARLCGRAAGLRSLAALSAAARCHGSKTPGTFTAAEASGWRIDRHTVTEARARGWEELENGDLLREAEAAGFEVLVTTDKNLSYRQNLKGRKIASVVLGLGRWSLIRQRVSRRRRGV
jgi:hypothetical protein